MTENEKKADTLFASWLCEPGDIRDWIRRIVVPLLRTPLDDQAREACKAHELAHPSHSRLGRRDPCAKCSFAGRDILAAEKPKERFYAKGNEAWERIGVGQNAARRAQFDGPDAGAETRAYVARKNAEDAR
jgi:hypothetical protein